MHVQSTMFNWNDLESFIILSRSGKLNLAAKKLKIEPTTISRRILRLEEKLNVKLFYRSNNQYILTDDGTRLIIFAEKIESEILSINEEFTNKNVNLTGVVRISLPEGLGIEIFTKYLKEFYKEHRDLEIELLADTKARSLSNKEVDISITLSRPKRGKLVSWKLSDYVIQLYGSKEYFTKNKSINIINPNEKMAAFITDNKQYEINKFKNSGSDKVDITINVAVYSPNVLLEEIERQWIAKLLHERSANELLQCKGEGDKVLPKQQIIDHLKKQQQEKEKQNTDGI